MRVDTSNIALICFRLAFSSLLVNVLVFHIINIYKVIHCQFTEHALPAFIFNSRMMGVAVAASV